MTALLSAAALAWLVTATSAELYSRTDGWYGVSPSVLASRVSQITCAIACRRLAAGCTGFTRTDSGTCLLFSEGNVAEIAVPGSVSVTHLLFSEGNITESAAEVEVEPCLAGWHLYRDSCYLRGMDAEPVTWQEGRDACRALHVRTDLASINDRHDETYLMQHVSRPHNAEFIGLRQNINGSLINVDGTSPAYQPVYDRALTSPTHDCFNLRSRRLMVLKLRACSELVSGYVCESPLECRVRSPCPDGWLALDSSCYRNVSTSMTWHDADTHCSALQAGAHLASPADMNTWRILQEQFNIKGTIVWFGISDAAEEGKWQTMDGTPIGISWGTNEPDGKGLQNCVAMFYDGGHDVPCGRLNPFLCQRPLTVC